MKRLIALLLCALLVLGSGPGVLAAEAPQPTAEFTLTQEGSGDIYWLELALRNTTFNVAQFAVHYDPKEFQLVDSAGAATEEPEKYQDNLSGGWLGEVGCSVHPEDEYFIACVFVMPGMGPKELRNENGTLTVKDTPLKLMRFRVKKLSEVKNGFAIACKDSGFTYPTAFPTGAATAAGSAEKTELVVKFAYADESAKNTEEVVKPVEKDPVQEETRKKRVEGTVVLQTGNSATVVEGTRKTIYSGEGSGVPYKESETLYVPLRFIAESLGAKVTWNGRTKPIEVEKDANKATITLNKAEYTVNGKTGRVAKPAVLKNSRTMVPVGMIEEILNVKYSNTDGLEILTPASAPWDSKNPIEQGLVADMALLLSPLISAVAGRYQ